MRKLKLVEHISLDGVIEHGAGYEHGDWTSPFRSPEGLQAVLDTHGASFDLVLGRRTYDLWSGHWPKAGRSPLADGINAATKHVATHRPESLAWGPALSLGADVFEGVRRVKTAGGPDLILWGSSTLTSELLGRGLVDEVVLFVYPVLLGRGKRLLSERADARQLALVGVRPLSTGVIVQTHRPVGPLRTGPAPGANA